MNIYFILLVFIILYMFKIVCNRIEGASGGCSPGCLSTDSYDRVVDGWSNKYNGEVDHSKQLNHNLTECRANLAACLKSCVIE